MREPPECREPAGLHLLERERVPAAVGADERAVDRHVRWETAATRAELVVLAERGQRATRVQRGETPGGRGRGAHGAVYVDGRGAREVRDRAAGRRAERASVDHERAG